MGGTDTPAVGWAAGIERLAMLVAEPTKADVFTVIADAPELETDALVVSALLRQAGIPIERRFATKAKRQIELSKKFATAGIFFVKRGDDAAAPLVQARYPGDDRSVVERAALALAGRYNFSAGDQQG